MRGGVSSNAFHIKIIFTKYKKGGKEFGLLFQLLPKIVDIFCDFGRNVITHSYECLVILQLESKYNKLSLNSKSSKII